MTSFAHLTWKLLLRYLLKYRSRSLGVYRNEFMTLFIKEHWHSSFVCNSVDWLKKQMQEVLLTERVW